MAEIGKDIQKAKVLLEQGELVGMPTETVYGLAANALNVDAVTKIFQVKNRPSFDPLIVHVPSAERAYRYVTAVPDVIKRLIEKFWPGPLTVLLPRKTIIPDLVTSGLERVGIRCPSHPVALELLRSVDFPLAAPSANPFGYVSPTQAIHVDEQLGALIPYILDGGPCDVGVESTIVGIENGGPVVYRLGGLDVESIEAVIGEVKVQLHSSSNPKAPGQLASHYAPQKPVIVGHLEELLQLYPAHQAGLLSYKKDYNSPFQFILSPSGQLHEAAKNLFTALRHFDSLPVDVILAEHVPDIGLGRAINDRLRRASAKRQP
jgi:L-threonylcarbamoyladenylate synthase